MQLNLNFREICCLTVALMAFCKYQLTVTGQRMPNLMQRSVASKQRAENLRFPQLRNPRQNGRQQQQMPFGKHKAGAKGHALINGEYVETNRVLLQRKSIMGIHYYPYGKSNIPVFIRSQNEINKKFIVFQDPYLPPGEGYVVVLKRIPPKAVSPSMRVSSMAAFIPPEIPYEAFHLQLGGSIQGSVDRLNIRRLAYDIRTKFASRKKARGKWMARRRGGLLSKRKFLVPGLPKRPVLNRGWRGKRSINSVEPFPPNSSCFMRRVNVSEIRIKLKTLSVTFPTSQAPASFFNQNVGYSNHENADFDYIEFK